MPPRKFSEIDWAILDERTYQQYMSGETVDGLKLSSMQRGIAQTKRAKATTFSKSDLQGNDLGAAPFANQAIPVAEFGVRWWFQYFWQEAKMVSTDADRERMAGICNRIFEKTPQGPRAYRMKDAFKDDDSGTAHPDAWREMMTDLLYVGFRAVEPARDGAPPLGPAPAHRAGHHLMMQTSLTPYLPERYTEDTEIFWRSETRDIERIIAQNGTKRQSDVKVIADEMNISRPWHPFSDPGINRLMWYRQGQNDNDYYTVISVATDFETALGFPKINELRVYGFPAKPLEQWTKDQVQMHRKNLAKVTLRTGEERVMLATRTTAYMCVIAGRMIDTKAAGGGFPEKGVSHIGLDQIFAYVPITRIHHGPAPEDGFTAFPDYDKGALLTGSFARSKDLFGAVYEKCCTEYFKAKYRGAIATAWTSGGPATPRIEVPVSRIVEFPVGETAFKAFRDARATGPGDVRDFLKAAGGNITNVLRPTDRGRDLRAGKPLSKP